MPALSKKGNSRHENPGFCAARAAIGIGRLLKRFSRFGRKSRRFLMARAPIIFRGTAGNSGDFGSGDAALAARRPRH